MENFLNEMINFYKMDGVMQAIIIGSIIMIIGDFLIRKIVKNIMEELKFKKHIKELRENTKRIINENVERLGVADAIRILQIPKDNDIELSDINKRIDTSNNENRELHEIIGCYICLKSDFDLKFQN